MRIYQLGDIGSLLMLDQQVLQLFNFVEELYCRGIIEMPAMQEVLR